MVGLSSGAAPIAAPWLQARTVWDLWVHLLPACGCGAQVPFGSAAFFPGRLVHTNELLAGLWHIAGQRMRAAALCP
eukprot:SM000224S07095  [mRNA]  locus=s224:70272:70913:+ [translate_table: standard]